MNPALTDVAERLAGEFPNETITRVTGIVTEGADAYPDADFLFVEQAARAQLHHRRGPDRTTP